MIFFSYHEHFPSAYTKNVDATQLLLAQKVEIVKNNVLIERTGLTPVSSGWGCC